ncbi:MAG: hypothetical protein LCH69_10850 [Proteobacteria bacterium]|nr:hypothetical protein [Pseudomonadota bacterium]
MHSEAYLKELLEEFPELDGEGIVYEKEVFAHFGLTFMGIALLEHGMINLVMLTRSARQFKKQKVRDASTWSDLIDSNFEYATQQTFGNLKKAILEHTRFRNLGGPLEEVKKLRDYFAHHFMRVDADLFSDRRGCALLMHRLQKARHQIRETESLVEAATHSFLRSIGLPELKQEDVDLVAEEMRESTKRRLAEGNAEVGWLKNAL